MATSQNKNIPILTDVIVASERKVDDVLVSTKPEKPDTDAVIAELQTRLAASTFALTDELVRTAFEEGVAMIRDRTPAPRRRDLPALRLSL